MKFLLVDDEPHILRLLQVNLQRVGHDVTLASSGTEALALLANYSFDRVVVDYSMPTPNGYDVLAYIRSTPTLSSLWVGLMIDDEAWKTVRNLPHQPDWVSVKPFDPNSLLG